eukprot:CAMPEP_0172665078 /NCGR_PEP_ID=MMETSP1074-20121228/7016_1 /TAXON_ID=2916 /ORGANISM="Ceratium fusus, Strain PA161109" /LENGTH=118 /DNA_ID=CAMNT_0013481333 /DNA_START=193 /DNA_END=550 /DNA_ORIENTATION=+
MTLTNRYGFPKPAVTGLSSHPRASASSNNLERKVFEMPPGGGWLPLEGGGASTGALPSAASCPSARNEAYSQLLPLASVQTLGTRGAMWQEPKQGTDQNTMSMLAETYEVSHESVSTA